MKLAQIDLVLIVVVLVQKVLNVLVLMSLLKLNVFLKQIQVVNGVQILELIMLQVVSLSILAQLCVIL